MNTTKAPPRPAASALSITPLTGSIGARIHGIDLREPADDGLAQLRQALLDHCLLVVPGQFLQADAQVAFAKRLGTPASYPGVDFGEFGLPNGVLRLVNDGKGKVITEHWHFDGMYLEQPPAIGILAAQTIPAAGGDTIWSNQYLAFETLSPGMQALLKTLRCHYVSVRIPKRYENNEAPVFATQPAVRRHPETGRSALYIGAPDCCQYFEGMTVDESQPLIRFLHAHGQRADFCYRHIWSPGDVVIWDNRCTMHYAVHDYGTAPRVMHRVVVKGDTAVAPA